MAREHRPRRARWVVSATTVLSWLVLLSVNGCRANSGRTLSESPALRVGVGGLPQQASQSGLRQFVASLSIEPLAFATEDGHLRPWLAQSWTTSDDGLSISIELRPEAKFHDGTPVTAPLVIQAINKTLPGLMGPAFDDISAMSADGAFRVRIALKRRSQFVLEALEIAIQNPDKPQQGTGPYVVSDVTAPVSLHANTSYYRERPAIDEIVVTPYPTVRAAWAELLRGNIDMLNEVNMDALDSLQGSSSIAVFSYVRHYQYMIMFGSRPGPLQSPEIRRDLSAAIDRDALVRNALNGHGRPSSGPIPPQHWALDPSAPKVTFDHQRASSLLGRGIRFKCLVPADSVYERVALAVKQQLAAASVDMEVEEATQEQILARSNDYEAVLLDPISGPTAFRSYRAFYSKVPFAPKPRTSPAIDAALDAIRQAASSEDYRRAVTAFQRAIVEDPPAIFLAWGERARAVSRRFDVPPPQSGTDVLTDIRLWRPALPQQIARQN